MTPTKTPFAGLEVLNSAQDPISSDGYYFTRVNPVITDALLRVGAVTHKHDGHAALANPALAPTLAALGAGGSLPSGLKIYVVYTLIDADGGETLPVAATSVTMPSGYHSPTSAATLTAIGGTLTKGSFSYGLSITDGAGGETAIGPVATAYGSGGFRIGNLTAITTAASGGAGGAGWRIWRRQNGGQLYLIATGAAATNTFDDTGVAGDCTIAPPKVNTTSASNLLHVTVPGGQPSGTVQFAIYASANGVFNSPALLGVYPAADLGSVKSYTSLLVAIGSPPPVTRAYPGAANLNAETEINHLHWWKPVADLTALGALGGNVDGDTRVTLDSHLVHMWDGSDWERLPTRYPVADFASLPTLDLLPGDTCMTLDTFLTYYWDGSDWERSPWRQPVANFAALPTIDLRDGDACMTLDTHVVWTYDLAVTAWWPADRAVRGTATTAVAGLVAATETAELINMMGPGMKVYAVTVDQQCRVRIYPTAALALTDIARAASADPDVAAQNGCYYEHTFAAAGTHILTPVVDAIMQEGTLAADIAANVSMVAGGAVNVVLHGYRLE